MSIEVEIVGGPHDGAVYAIENLHEIHMVEQVASLAHYLKEEASAVGPMYATKSLPIHLTRNGYRAYWGERT